MRQTITIGTAGNVAKRTVVLLIALIAMLMFTTTANLSASANGAQPASQPAAQTPKAVIIVGPTHGQTAEYLEWGENIADEAEAKGMEVVRLYHPNATWARVIEETTGANLLVYLGHGNGWPSPYPPFQENTKDGLGLNYPELDKRGTGDVKYYGGDRIRASLHLAPNAIVILNHACYSAGQGEPGMATPSKSIAMQRVDNFAAGFLAVGARTVFGLYYQFAEDVVGSLMTEHTTVEGVFRNRYNPWNNGNISSFYGWVGEDATYHNSVRTPGTTVLLDHDPDEGYTRSLAGDLTMTTDTWRGSADPSDVVDPVVVNIEGVPSVGTLPAGENALPVFTPNGDGLSDTLAVDTTVSEDAYLDFAIRTEAGDLVRTFSAWSDEGDSTSIWNGKNDAGAFVAEGKYDVFVTPRDLAGNVGDAVSTRVKVLKAMKSPTGTPNFIFARDGDTLRQTSAMSVTMTADASLSWKINDASGNTVRTFMADQAVSAGLLSQVWDGRDGSGAYVPDGMYSQVLTATTDNGTYSHVLAIRVMPFKITAPTWAGPAGTKVTFTVLSAEPLSGYASIWVKQPGLAKYRAYPVRSSSTKFKFTVTFKAGTAGVVNINITGTDTKGGKNLHTVTFTLQ